LKFEVRKPPTSNPDRHLFWPTHSSFHISHWAFANPALSTHNYLPQRQA